MTDVEAPEPAVALPKKNTPARNPISLPVTKSLPEKEPEFPGVGSELFIN